jgi:hypothetical protein
VCSAGPRLIQFGQIFDQRLELAKRARRKRPIDAFTELVGAQPPRDVVPLQLGHDVLSIRVPGT